MDKNALILVDIQREYFAGGKVPLVHIDEAAANAARLVAHARAAGDLVIHIQHVSAGGGPPIFLPGTPGIEISPVVAPEEGEPVVVKHYPNSFRGTALRKLLDEAGVKNVLIVGAMSHMCIDATARAAADFGYGVTVAHDACATRDLEFGGTAVPAAQVHAAQMAALAFGYARIASAAELVG